MTRRRLPAAGPSAVSTSVAAVAPVEPPVAWPDHPLAVSGGELLATRILPLVGHNARDFARAAAVCPGWRAACRAASTTLKMYRETALTQIEGEANFSWFPCGKLVAAAVYNPPRLFIWRASTGALLNEWALATPATVVPDYILEQADYFPTRVAFFRDYTRVLTLFDVSNHFAIWSVPEGQLLAVKRDRLSGVRYNCASAGVPGSASDGLVGLGSSLGVIDLWDLTEPSNREAYRPYRRNRIDVEPAERSGRLLDFALSGDGSKFAASFGSVTYVYDVASLTRLGAYTSPSKWPMAAWAPDGQRVLVSWEQSACVWDFSHSEAPPIVTADVGPSSRLHVWSPSGASYFVTRKLKGRPRYHGLPLLALEERRAADGALVRAVYLGHSDNQRLSLSPDAHAMVLNFYNGRPAPRVAVFD